MRNHGRVDRIGLGPSAERLSKGSHLRRIDHNDRQGRRGQARRNDGLKTARGLDRDDAGSQLLQPFRQLLDTRSGAGDDKTLTARTHTYIQPVLGNVNSDNMASI